MNRRNLLLSMPSRASAPVIPTRSTAALSRRKTSSLAGRAYLQIREKILKGDLPVGDVISRRKLAAELNISVPPVTEALQQLEAEGLLESKPRVGTRVRVPTPQEIEDRCLVREALESQAARLFAERATVEEKKALRQMGRRVDQLYACCEAQTVDRGFLFSANTYHMKLHLRIAECGRCAALHDAIEKEQVLVFNWLYDTAVERRTLASDHHVRLTDALARGTADQAEAAMRRHIRVGLQEVLAKLDGLKLPERGWRVKRKDGVK
jgi:DNA-binding GntR family transcriptional regulator